MYGVSAHPEPCAAMQDAAQTKQAWLFYLLALGAESGPKAQCCLYSSDKASGPSQMGWVIVAAALG